jgi:hypothetical protein
VSQAGGGHFKGVCFNLNGSKWEVVEDVKQVLAAGSLPPSFDATAWHTIELAIKAQLVFPSLDGKALVPAGVAVQATAGMVGLTTGWNYALFDDFKSNVAKKAQL